MPRGVSLVPQQRNTGCKEPISQQMKLSLFEYPSEIRDPVLARALAAADDPLSSPITGWGGMDATGTAAAAGACAAANGGTSSGFSFGFRRRKEAVASRSHQVTVFDEEGNLTSRQTGVHIFRLRKETLFFVLRSLSWINLLSISLALYLLILVGIATVYYFWGWTCGASESTSIVNAFYFTVVSLAANGGYMGEDADTMGDPQHICYRGRTIIVMFCSYANILFVGLIAALVVGKAEYTGSLANRIEFSDFCTLTRVPGRIDAWRLTFRMANLENRKPLAHGCLRLFAVSAEPLKEYKMLKRERKQLMRRLEAMEWETREYLQEKAAAAAAAPLTAAVLEEKRRAGATLGLSNASFSAAMLSEDANMRAIRAYKDRLLREQVRKKEERRAARQEQKQEKWKSEGHRKDKKGRKCKQGTKDNLGGQQSSTRDGSGGNGDGSRCSRRQPHHKVPITATEATERTDDVAVDVAEVPSRGHRPASHNDPPRSLSSRATSENVKARTAWTAAGDKSNSRTGRKSGRQVDSPVDLAAASDGKDASGNPIDDGKHRHHHHGHRQQSTLSCSDGGGSQPPTATGTTTRLPRRGRPGRAGDSGGSCTLSRLTGAEAARSVSAASVSVSVHSTAESPSRASSSASRSSSVNSTATGTTDSSATLSTSSSISSSSTNYSAKTNTNFTNDDRVGSPLATRGTVVSFTDLTSRALAGGGSSYTSGYGATDVAEYASHNPVRKSSGGTGKHIRARGGEADERTRLLRDEACRGRNSSSHKLRAAQGTAASGASGRYHDATGDSTDDGDDDGEYLERVHIHVSELSWSAPGEAYLNKTAGQLSLWYPATITHIIDERSPLFRFMDIPRVGAALGASGGLGSPNTNVAGVGRGSPPASMGLSSRKFQIVAVFDATEMETGATIMAKHTYTTMDIMTHYKFSNKLVHMNPESREVLLDYHYFNELLPFSAIESSTTGSEA